MLYAESEGSSEDLEGAFNANALSALPGTDFDRCVELYKANEPGRFPAGVCAQYERMLREQSSLILVGERDGQIVCTGGINRFHMDYLVVLCFGLVDPCHHNTGIGTASILARLAMLDPNISSHTVFIFAVTKSIGFYHRMGFQRGPGWKDPHGQNQPSATLIFNYHEIYRAMDILRLNGITFPERPASLPMQKVAEEPS